MSAAKSKGHSASKRAAAPKRRSPRARQAPISTDCAALIGSMKGRIRVKGDIMSTDIRWNAQS
jgi:hypothetical protein